MTGKFKKYWLAPSIFLHLIKIDNKTKVFSCFCIGGQTLLICSKLISFFFVFFSLLTRFTWQRLTPVTNISVFWRFTTRCVHKRNLNKIGDNAWPDTRRYNKATYCHILLVQIIRSTDLKSNKKLIFLINISLISQYHVS